jgi:hypothetical protein
LRACTEPVLTRALGRSVSVAEHFERVYPRVKHLLAADPRYGFRYISLAVRLSRR